MICACCGYEITGKSYSVEKGKKAVCEKCWNDPNLFFEEKIQNDDRLKLLSKMAEEKRNQQDYVDLKVLKLVQKGVPMFSGKMKVKDILELCELDKFKEEELEGYQRERYEDRTSELVEYLTKCPLAVMPALLLSLRETEFESQDGDFGVLRIPRKKGCLWIIDGQHRVGGFGKILEKFTFSKELDPVVFSDLMEYEFPVVFVDSQSAARTIGQTLERSENDFSIEDIERTIFFIVNKTQKGISPSLKDALLYRINTSGIQGLPSIERESWRIVGAKIGIAMNRQDDSPLKGKINISGRRETGRPIQLNSFVSSLQTLFLEKEFYKLDDEQKSEFLKNYWRSLKELLPEAFDKKTEREYMLLKALGVYSLHWLAKDIFRLTMREGLDFKDAEVLKKNLTPIKSFDWGTKTSPLSALGGMKGASKAHELLLSVINQPESTQSPGETLGNYFAANKA